MKPALDYTHPDIVEIYDEIPLWSAPFGRLLLDNIPMGRSWKIVDLGFGTGFPLIELAQRFDKNSSIIGYDIWESAISRAEKKIRLLGLENITIHNLSASVIEEESETVDLVCSNLGVNNFSDRQSVLANIYRILKPQGHFCFTSNTTNSMSEIHQIFIHTLKALGLDSSILLTYINKRVDINKMISEIENYGFSIINRKADTSIYRFTSGESLFNHSIIRLAFVSSWKNLVPEESWGEFYNKVISLIDKKIEQNGVFQFTVPIEYLHLQKT